MGTNNEKYFIVGMLKHPNGLVYGNGGLKCWPRPHVLDMKTHEALDDEEGMEFCWKLNYIQLNDTF